MLTDTKGNQQLFACCSDNGGLESSDDARPSKEKGIILGKNFLKLKLEDYNLKIGETYKMTIKGLKNDYYVNFKYIS